jgi:ketosteroid isomerase-like protein
MSLEAIQRVYEEWGRGNWRPRFDIYADDMEWGWSEEFPGLAGVYRDPAERNERLLEWLSPWEHWTCEAEDYVVGVDVATKGAHLWTLRDGMCIRLEVFADREKALAAAGLTSERYSQ